MKILYDHQMYSLQKYGGITKYFCELIKNLPSENEYELSLLYSNNQHLKDDFRFFRKIYLPVPQSKSRLSSHLRVKGYEINSRYSKYKISQGRYDIFHPTYFDPYFLSIIKKPYIVTVHDLIAFKFDVRNKEKRRQNMKKIVTNANHIIAISENTKRDLMDELQIDSERIDVVYHGFHSPRINVEENKWGRYLLYVGARADYKNFSLFAQAFSLLACQDEDLKLICTGGAFDKNESDYLQSLNILDKSFAMGVDERRLSNLYRHALAFVYPTKYEGFGMSILEAFANQCPVCLSDSSCLPEIAGEGGSYFNPDSPESMVAVISKVIYDEEYAGEMIKKGNARLKFFSWQKCARQTVEAYQKALA